jgi:hypothetical protein
VEASHSKGGSQQSQCHEPYKKLMAPASFLLGIIACLLNVVFEYNICAYKKRMMMMVQPIILPIAFDIRTKALSLQQQYWTTDFILSD